tara:strand:+ start:3378 stop:3950 length:573 start_codon:yes stop_codon:yes gene_type:complete
MIIENINIKEINLSNYNPRLLSKENKKQLKISIEKFGLIDPIILNKNPERKNILIGGHQRFKICKELKFKTIPCIYVDLNLNDEKELNIRLNKNIGEFDFKLLESHFQHEKLIEWGFSPFQFDEINFIDDPDAIIENKINYGSSNSDNDSVTFELTVTSEQKKSIMKKINHYKKNKEISNGQALCELLNI